MITYKRKELSSDIKKILKSESNVYGQASAIEKYIEQNNTKDCNTLLLMSTLEWECGKATLFPEDIISFGEKALHWLEKAIKTDPSNKQLAKSYHDLEKEIKKAEKKEIKNRADIIEAEKQPIETLKADPYLTEIAFYYFSRCKNSKEDADKAHQYYTYLYEKLKLEDSGHESLLYYWNALTYCKFLSQGYLKTEKEIKKLQDWKVAPDIYIYKDAINDGFWFEMHHLSQIDDLESFRTVFLNWRRKMKSVWLKSRNSEGPIYYKSELVVPICSWLLEKTDVNKIERIIFENCKDGFVTTEEKQILKKLEEKLKQEL